MSVATLFDVVEARSAASRRTMLQVAAVVGGSLLLALSAQAQIWLPGKPAPITPQTLTVIALGIALGPRLGAAAAALYLLECLALPAFSATGRVLVSGGYLLGFIPAAYLAGALYRAGYGRSWKRALLAAVPANLVILALGTLWIGAWTNGWSQALGNLFGFYLLVDAVKIALCAPLFRGLDGLVGGLGRRS